MLLRAYNPGEIVDVEFPFEDKDEGKLRPALVWRDVGETFLLFKITSKQKGRKWDVLLPKDNFNGLDVDSVIQIDRLQRLDKSKLKHIIPRGNLTALQMMVVGEKFKEFMSPR